MLGADSYEAEEKPGTVIDYLKSPIDTTALVMALCNQEEQYEISKQQ